VVTAPQLSPNILAPIGAETANQKLLKMFGEKHLLVEATRLESGRGRARANRAITQKSGGTSQTVRTIRVIDVYGILSNASDGDTHYSDIVAECMDAVTDPNVDGVILHVDSPGGDTTSAFEAADEIAAMAKVKPIYSVVDGGAYSAAYLLASQTERIFVQPKTGGVGSIGVYCAHIDMSGFLEKMGVKVTFISKGEGKVDGNPYEPLSEAGAAQLKTLVETDYGYFVSAVVSGRGLTEKKISDLGARLYFGADAISKGLATDAGGMREAVSAMCNSLGCQPKKGSSAKAGSVNQEAQTMAETNGNQTTEATASAEALRAQAHAEGIQAEQARSAEIVDLCEIAGQPAKAAGFIKAGKSVADVRKALLENRAKAGDKPGEIDTAVEPGAGTGAAAKPAKTLAQKMSEMLKAGR
jgi:capsid assembly protease